MRVLPSEIVNCIDSAIPVAAEGEPFDLDISHSGFLSAVVALVERIDPALQPQDPTDSACLIASASTIANTVARWKAQGGMAGSVRRTQGFGNQNPVSHIRRILSSLADTVIPPATVGLEFIEDEDRRTDLRRDVASVEALLSQEQWKAAMVIAGSIMEALLYDQLANDEKNSVGVARDLAKQEPMGPLGTDLTRWHLLAYARTARKLGVIRSATCEQVLLGGDFRNLVHPGKAIREEMSCTRGTALATAGALFLVVDDLSRTRGEDAVMD